MKRNTEFMKNFPHPKFFLPSSPIAALKPCFPDKLGEGGRPIDLRRLHPRPQEASPTANDRCFTEL